MAYNILVYPFGGNSREAVSLILKERNKDFKILGFIDDDKGKQGVEFCGIKVLGGRSVINKYPSAKILAVPGNPKDYLKRKKIIESLPIPEKRFVSFTHPSAVVALDARIGANTLIMPNVVIGASARVGSHCIILPNTVIGHDAVIGDYTCIGAGVIVSGSVAVGKCCYIGSASSIIDNVSIGDSSLIGLGANVISDVPNNVVAAGNPAKIIRKAA